MNLDKYSRLQGFKKGSATVIWVCNHNWDRINPQFAGIPTIPIREKKVPLEERGERPQSDRGHEP